MRGRTLVRWAVLALAALPVQGAAANKSFNVASGDWSVDGNWNPSGVPAPTDDVTIPAARAATLNAPGATVASLTLAGTLQGDGNLTVTGTTTWTAGQMGGSGVTNANGPLVFSGAGAVSLAGTRTLNNGGAATWTGGAITMSATAVLNNLPSASFTVQTSADVNSGTFNNAGTLTKSAGGGDGITRFTGVFNNTGSLAIGSGEIQLDAGGTHESGDFTLAAGTTLEFGGGTHTLSMGATVSGAGTVDFAGGTTNLSEVTYALGGATTVTGGTANFTSGATVTAIGNLSIGAGTLNLSSGESIVTASYTQTGGLLLGSDNLSVTGALVWNGGSMGGSGATNANAGMQIDNLANIGIVDTRTVNNAGLATWTGNNIVNTANGVFNNLAGATFSIETSSDIFAGTFHNAGTVNKTGGGGVTRVTGALDNGGSLTVTAGRLELDGGGTHNGGNFAVSSLAELQFGGGTHAMNGGTHIGGAGVVEFGGGTATLNGGTYAVTGGTVVTGGTTNFNAGLLLTSLGTLAVANGTLNLDSGEAVSTASYEQESGTVAGADVLSVGGLLVWTGGAMGGSGVTNANGGLQISNTANVSLNDTRTLNNASTAVWSGVNFIFGSSAVFNNLPGAMFSIQTSADIFNGTFNNAGVLAKTAGSGDGVTRSTGVLNNTGAVSVSSGALDLDGGGTHAGSFTAESGASLIFGGGTSSFGPGSAIGGAGRIEFHGGTNNLGAGTYSVSGSTAVSGGTVNFTGGLNLLSVGALEIASPGILNASSGETIAPSSYTQTGGTLTGSDVINVAGLLHWRGGTMGGSGVSNANGGMEINNSGNVGITETRVVNNAGAAVWSGANFTNGATGVFNNLATGSFSVQTSGDFLGGTFGNAGTLDKDPGLGDGVTQFTGSFNNSGLVSANSGVLQYNGAFHQTAGRTRLNGGAISTNTGLNIDGGRLEGSGTITGNVTNAGVVAPGLSPGALDEAGAFNQTQSGTLAIEIGGTDPANFDRVALTGAVATLGGTLDVSLVNGFTPSLGDSFKIMTFPSRSGDFANATGLLLGGGRGFRKALNAADLTLLVVQEICDDLVDNDGDGFIDCDDVKCSVVAVCMGTPTSTRTRTATITPTPSSAQTATRTATAGATGTATRTPTATATATPTIACAGDCGGTGMVSEEDIESAIEAIFDVSLAGACNLDRNHDGRIVVAELLEAIRSRASNCAPPPTPLPTSTRTVTPILPTVTPGEIPPAVSGGTTIAVNAMSVIPSLVTAIAEGIDLGGGATLPRSLGGSGAGACPLSGTASRTGSFPVVTVGLQQCELATADGSVTYDGTASLAITSFNVNITAIFADNLGSETRRATAMLTGTVSPSLGGDCLLTAATFTVSSGSLSVRTPDGTQVGATFQGTQVRISGITFNDDCVPTRYTLTFNGPASLLTPAGVPVPVSFSNLVMVVDDSGSPTLFTLSGGMTSTCFGGAVTLSTAPPLAVQDNDLCPTAGTVLVTSPSDTASVIYNADGSVTIDRGGTGMSYPNCLDERLLMCAA